MNQEQVEAFLDRIGAPADNVAGEWVMASCPLAPYTDEHKGSYDSTPSFGVHIEDEGMSFYNCFTCHNKGPISDLAKKLGRLQDDNELFQLGLDLDKNHYLLEAETAYREWNDGQKTEDKSTATRPTVVLSEPSLFAKYPSVFSEPRAVNYLRRRGIGFSAIVSLGLRYDPAQYRILFPIYRDCFDRYGEKRTTLAGFSGRTIRNNRYIKHRNSLRKGSYPKIRDYAGLEKEKLILSSPRYDAVVHTEYSIYGGQRGRLEIAVRRDKCVYEGYTVGGGGGGQTSGPIGLKRPVRRFAIVIEGLIGLARMETIVPEIDTVALLGSKVGEAKIQRLLERNQALYWLTDNDEAGRSCIFGNKDINTGKHRFKTGALYQIGNRLPQFIMHWPKLDEPVTRDDGSIRYYKEDPDELTREEVLYMIDNAEIYVHRGR